MLLAIDIGNTNTVLGSLRGRNPRRPAGGSRPTRAPPPTRDPGVPRTVAGSSDHRDCCLHHRSGRPARTAHDARPLLRGRPAGDRRAGGVHRRRAAVRQPEGDRRRPHLQHRGGVPPHRRAVDRRRLRHVDQLRRRRRQGRVPRRGARHRHRDLHRRPRHPGRGPAQGRARRTAQPDRQEHGRGPAVRDPLRVRGPGRRPDPPVDRGAAPRRPRRGAGHRHRRPVRADDRSVGDRSPGTSPTSPCSGCG